MRLIVILSAVLLLLHTPPALTEDSPAWNCAVHGNATCGPSMEPVTRGWTENVKYGRVGP